MSILRIVLVWISVSTLAIAKPQPEFRIESKSHTVVVTIKDLRQKLKPVQVLVDDPVYNREKRYEGFLLREVLALGGVVSAQGPVEAAGDELVLKCADGYSPTLSLAKLSEYEGVLAFREIGARVEGRTVEWTTFTQGKSKITPAPFYLVWKRKGTGSDAKSPSAHEVTWPYQLVGVELVSLSQKWDRIYPHGINRDEPVFRGFERFRGLCLRCHSLNLQGGELGPELNFPMNITEYWTPQNLKKFIYDPSDFRARSKMPPFKAEFEGKGVVPSAYDDLVSYLLWMKDRKKGE